MQTAIEGFLRYLRIERNASPLTLKSYGADLADLLEFFRSSEDRLPSPATISIAQLRAFVADLHQRGYARSTVARSTVASRTVDHCTVDHCSDGWVRAGLPDFARVPAQPNPR